MFERFEVIPALDLKGGKCVQLVQGDPMRVRISIDDPLEVASLWEEEGARILHIIDLDGAIHGERINASIVGDVVSTTKLEVQIGGGIRTVEDAITLLDMGATRVILSTMLFDNPTMVEALIGEVGGEAVMGALDAREGRVSIKGWTKDTNTSPEDAGIQIEEMGIRSVLFTNIEREGLLDGVNVKPTKQLVKVLSIPVVAAGGVSTVGDLLALREAGASSAVVGSALYTGAMSLKEAMRVLSE
ncbi:MAG: 1-(5-phosphoribosyl)-5-[(5-phosphoribosylamino)methylideneamino]imidazole-4-carboxamide isomerase [Methermicoccaceae archaeon]